MNLQHSYLEKQHDSLKDASQPKKEELKQLDELKKIISGEEKKIDKLIEGSKQLKEKVSNKWNCIFIFPSSNSIFFDCLPKTTKYNPFMTVSCIFILVFLVAQCWNLGNFLCMVINIFCLCFSVLA